MRKSKFVLLTLSGVMGLGTGCHTNTVDKEAFKSAINSYYSGKQECVWSAPVKFPAQADTSNDEQTKGFDALTDAGLLARKTAEKSRFLIGSKQVNDYDLSDKGRSTWTADQTQPGYGNFCFGHLEVSSIDSYTPPDANSALQCDLSLRGERCSRLGEFNGDEFGISEDCIGHSPAKDGHGQPGEERQRVAG